MTLTKLSINNSPLKSILLLSFVTLAGCLLYTIIEHQSLKHSAVLFLGIPVLMSITLATSCNVNYITLNVMLGLSLGLLASFIFLNEGSFCVPMTAPLFMASGLIISLCITKLRRSNYTRRIYFLPIILLILLSIEGINSPTSFNRSQSINVSKDLAISSYEIEHALADNKTFSDLPYLLKFGFPQPVSVTNQGNKIGDIRTVYFSGGEGEPGTAEFKITQRSENFIEYALINDTSHISHWLQWKTSRVSWHPLDSGIVRVNWTITYERNLDPAWYFSPIQNLAVKFAAQSLINNLVE